ncbi:hypothetical protein BGX29_007467 [Mortierella sp. GBA35]|nr:hypothetical protein BGX29_007467 [Mortierella sp. GBA35]
MEKNEPMEVRKLNMPLVRHSLILVRKHNKYAALWEALTLYKRIDRLEVHLDVFVYQDAIHHANTESFGLESRDWNEPVYFHGTGNCGCIDILARTEQPPFGESTGAGTGTGAGLFPISAGEWCQSDDCETRGILMQGYRREHSLHKGRHYFSEDIHVAVEYTADGLQKKAVQLPVKPLFPLFLCKARNIHQGHEAFHRYVMSDNVSDNRETLH